jgi:hypothetical protein
VAPPEGARVMEENTSPTTALISSSVAGHDCCGGFGNIDFRQVQLRFTERVGLRPELAGAAFNA